MNYLRDLVADGYVGEVLSTTVIGSAGDTWGAYSDPNSRYLLDPANGATFALTNSRCAGTLTDTTTKSTSSQAARSVACRRSAPLRVSHRCGLPIPVSWY